MALCDPSVLDDELARMARFQRQLGRAGEHPDCDEAEVQATRWVAVHPCARAVGGEVWQQAEVLPPEHALALAGAVCCRQGERSRVVTILDELHGDGRLLVRRQCGEAAWNALGLR